MDGTSARTLLRGKVRANVGRQDGDDVAAAFEQADGQQTRTLRLRLGLCVVRVGVERIGRAYGQAQCRCLRHAQSHGDIHAGPTLPR